jgi:UDP-N-acetylmuramyl pentapeptide synthase
MSLYPYHSLQFYRRSYENIRVKRNVIIKRALYRLAIFYRRQLDNTTFIAITGSCGKTTTKDLITSILFQQFRAASTHDTANATLHHTLRILTLWPFTQFSVHELGASGPGSLDEQIALIKPRIGVVTNIGNDHYTAFRGQEAAAAEKAKLIASLPEDGTAVLNADDPLVLSMRSKSNCRVLTYGYSEQSVVRADQVTSSWPRRLSLRVSYQGQKLSVSTRLCGVQFTSSVLAAITTALALDVPLVQAVKAVATVKPWIGRMSPQPIGRQITIIRDNWKAPLWGIPATFEFLKAAHARRKILVIGTIADFPGSTAPKYRAVAKQAVEIADKVIFVGKFAQSALKALPENGSNILMAFASPLDLHHFLQTFLEPGDLLLLKGSIRPDHLERIALAQTQEIACWRHRCDQKRFCDDCKELT